MDTGISRAGGPGAPVIETHGLTKCFGKLTAVRELDLVVGRGEIFGFLGPNGAGKSTTIRMLLGLVRPTSGSARVLGHDVRHNCLPALRRIGALVETPAFYDYLSGRKNLEILACMSGGAPSDRIGEVLRLVGLQERGLQRVGAYSHGMRQRLGLAQALLPDPELLILDEPAGGLDPEGLYDVRNLLTGLAAQGVTIFLSSHLLHEVELICTDVGLIRNGTLIARGKTTELLRGSRDRLAIQTDDPDRALAILRSLPEVEEAMPAARQVSGAFTRTREGEGADGRGQQPGSPPIGGSRAQFGARSWRGSAHLAGGLPPALLGPGPPRMRDRKPGGADEPGEGGWVEAVAPRESAAAINAALVREGIAVSALVPASLSLEEFYLQVARKRRS